MSKTSEEWLRQSEYDADTAKCMLDGGRHFYAVFMCHLSVEKAVKALYVRRLNEDPPKIHNFILLLGRIGLQPPADIGQFMARLNQANVATRYPESLDQLREDFPGAIAAKILEQTREALQWIRTQL